MITIVLWLVGTLIVVLGPIILIHELGHFIFAKLAGVRVEEFGFGFPPRMVKLWRGKGSVEIDGQTVNVPRNVELPAELEMGNWVEAWVSVQDDGEVVLRRLVVLDGPPERPSPGPGTTAGETGLIRGRVGLVDPGTVYSLNWLPLGAFVRMTGEEDPSDPRSLAAQPKRWRLAVLGAGAFLNVLVALFLITGAYASGVPQKWVTKITQIEVGSAADEAGLLAGDVVVAVDGQPIEMGAIDLVEGIKPKPHRMIELSVLRDGESLTVQAVPAVRPEGCVCTPTGLLGIHISTWPDWGAVAYYTLPEAVGAGVSDAVDVIVMTLRIPSMLLQGDISPQQARPASIVGISEVLTLSLQQSIEWGLPFHILRDAAFVSLVLGLSNLLPLPALDGGRILFVLIEALRGRRIPPEKEAVIHFVGFVLLVGLMALIMFQDLVNPVLPWSFLE